MGPGRAFMRLDRCGDMVRVAQIGMVLAALVVATPTSAQERRTRTLTFDPVSRQWVERAAPQAGTAEGDLHQIKTLNARGAFRQALKSVKAFVKTHGVDHPLYPEVLLEKAESYIGRQDFTRAHDTLQSFLGEFGGVALTEEALRMELVTAEAFLKGAKRRVWGIFRFSGTDLAYRILDEISVGFPESRYAEAAIKTKADHLYDQGEFDLAELEYARLVREHPRTRYHQFAQRRIADAALASFAGVYYDEAALIEAEERYREYAASYPAAAQQQNVDAIIDGILESRAEKDYLIGWYYERTGHRRSAKFYYENVMRDWPESIAAGKAYNRLGILDASETGAGGDGIASN